MAITPALMELQCKFNFIVNGLTPAAFIGKKISITLENESQRQSVILLKKACPYFKHTHKIVLYHHIFGLQNIDRVLTEVMEIFKPREIEIYGKRDYTTNMKPASNMLFVHKLTVPFDDLEWILTKIQPIHTLRVTDGYSQKFRVDPNLWSSISHLNLKRLEVEGSSQIDLLTIKQINDLPITQKVIHVEDIEIKPQNP